MDGYTNFTKVHADIIHGDSIVGNVVASEYVPSAGITIAALTAAIGNPTTLHDGTFVFIKDTTDSNAIRAIVVIGGAFYYGGKYTVATA